jgi:hypothetical protein
VKHFIDVKMEDRSKVVGLHFSLPDHNGIQDIRISVLEFIKKCLKRLLASTPLIREDV